MPIETRNLPIVIAKVQAIEAQAINAAAKGLARGLVLTVGIVQREYLQGPRPVRLGERTGRLRNSITSRVEIVPGKGAIGRIGTNVKYAAYHEFGFSGVQQVRAHTRVLNQVNGRGISSDLRRAIFDDKGTFVGFKDTRKASSRALKSGFAQVEFVKAHPRTVNYKGRPFVRPAVEKMTPKIVQEIQKELGYLTQ